MRYSRIKKKPFTKYAKYNIILVCKVDDKMNKNKLIIENCPNFYKIINFDYFEEDYFTANLIKIYRDFVFLIDPSSEVEITKVKEIDKILAKYIDDYIFRKEMKYELLKVKITKDENLLQNLINSIIGIFEQFEEGKTRKIYISRWI